MENTIVPKENHLQAQVPNAAADWKIIECKKHLLVIDVAGKTLRLVSKPLASKTNRSTKCRRIAIPGCGNSFLGARQRSCP
jgi:hexokinase